MTKYRVNIGGRRYKTFKTLATAQKFTNEVIDKLNIFLNIEEVKEDRPEYGKLYSLTGGHGQPCVFNGNTWAESEVVEK